MLQACGIVKVSGAKVITIEPALWLQFLVRTFPTVIVHTIEPASDGLSVEEVDKVFSIVFARVCALGRVNSAFLHLSWQARAQMEYYLSANYVPP